MIQPEHVLRPVEEWPNPARLYEGPQAWQMGAACYRLGKAADKIFFPERGGSTKQAKLLCQQCEVRIDCLEYALDQRIIHGIWGGLSERERKQIRRNRGNRRAS